ncbi:FadR/GntR family transcriptional regulator [Streptomyces griseorubiginosus]|uniref:FadR/GntR family transcriptional regulator n=1 Tax=Streptomyces griseorubiginosus TaxID=67304 RepID=UPI002E803FA6|nr:FCD domain-containing protein [Streptomyces griseorubiginosus]WUB41965.1 FCD domain-containing protein [Streptomyces griseorubiginosus]WUB50485.1 FCD domain-containing protein [Streptomyces griseorubiginosus]
MSETGRRGGGGLGGVQVRVPKMAELVAARLRRMIVRGELAEGDALPSETALMEEFAVSRPTLREAFRVLESESLITVRRGARGGARVQVPEGTVAARYAGVVLEYRGTTLKDVYDARTVIEAPCAGLLAERRTDEDLRRLRDAVDEAEGLMDDPSAFIRAHMEFHALVVELAGNETLGVLNGMVRHIIDQANWSHVDLDAGSPENIRANRRGFRAHRALVDLVAARSAEAAEELWRVHLQEAEDYLLRSRSMTTVLDLLG